MATSLQVSCSALGTTTADCGSTGSELLALAHNLRVPGGGSAPSRFKSCSEEWAQSAARSRSLPPSTLPLLRRVIICGGSDHAQGSASAVPDGDAASCSGFGRSSPIKCGSNQVRVQSSAGRTEGECPRPISCWSVPARGHASNCLASSRHPACACPVVASPRRTGPTPRRRQRAIEPAIAAAMRRIERGLGSSQGPQKRAIRGRIVAGVEWLGGRVKTRFAPFEAGWRGCARAPAACRGGRVPPQFCCLKTAESCADEAKTLVFSGSDLC